MPGGVASRERQAWKKVKAVETLRNTIIIIKNISTECGCVQEGRGSERGAGR